jgi:transposase-like protein
MTTDKRGISALLLQRQLGLRRYETAWMMLHKLRRAMINLEREPLRGEVEVDETWIGGTQAGLRGSRQLKGRKAALVLVAVEKRGRVTGRARMAVIPDFKSATRLGFLKENVALGSTVYTDGLKSFAGLQQAGFQHVPLPQPLRIDLRKGGGGRRAVRKASQVDSESHRRIRYNVCTAYAREQTPCSRRQRSENDRAPTAGLSLDCDDQASSLSMSFSEYMRSLIRKDLERCQQ